MMSTRKAGTELQPLIEAVKQGQFDRAIGGLKQFLTDWPDHEVALGLLASTYFQIGMPEAARERYERLLENNPANALARFQLGLILLDSDPARSLELWQPLLAVENEFMAHFHSALARIRLGDPVAARPLLEQAARHMPPGHPLHAQLLQLRARLAASTQSGEYRQ
jgi:tetratricopeptide (TPR) repeat protein